MNLRSLYSKETDPTFISGFLEEKKENGNERIFKEIIVQNFPNLAKDISTDSKVKPK